MNWLTIFNTKEPTGAAAFEHSIIRNMKYEKLLLQSSLAITVFYYFLSLPCKSCIQISNAEIKWNKNIRNSLGTQRCRLPAHERFYRVPEFWSDKQRDRQTDKQRLQLDIYIDNSKNTQYNFEKKTITFSWKF